MFLKFTIRGEGGSADKRRAAQNYVNYLSTNSHITDVEVFRAPEQDGKFLSFSCYILPL